MKINKKEIILITVILIIQTIVFVVAGINKAYIHMDEAYSLGLASYNKTEIQENEDFYNTWHSKEYYKDYLVVNENEKNNFAQVYENQKNDVHPPLYYLLLRIAMGFNIDEFSMWPGIIINIVIYIFITIFMYLIIKKILGEDDKGIEKSAILSLISAITLASISNAIYIRMYVLSTFNIVLTTYLHLKLLDSEKINHKLFIAIGIMALARVINTLLLFILLSNAFYNVCYKICKRKKLQKINRIYRHIYTSRYFVISNFSLFNTTYIFWI